jgi:DNA processing protein
MENELFYRLALTRVRGIGAFHAKALFNQFGKAADIFRASPADLAKIRGIGKARAWAVAGFNQFDAVQRELAFLEKYKIRPLFFTDKDYPTRLANCSDAPALLYYRGEADLNSAKVIAFVGTRRPTEHGKQAVDQLVRELAFPDLLLVSGLAYGIDVASHKAALNCQVPTVGILGHGLDRIYPQQHAALAREMVKHGGLLTQFGIDTEPDEHNFPVRNRIIAGMSDVLIVIETAHRGGSILTVENAITYRKKIFALPGRITDERSAGCNALIQNGKACMLTNIQDVIQELQWKRPIQTDGSAMTEMAMTERAMTGVSPKQRPVKLDDPLPSDEGLSGEEKTILDLIVRSNRLSLDELLRNEHLNRPEIPMVLLDLELKGIIRSLPGKIYCVRAGR